MFIDTCVRLYFVQPSLERLCRSLYFQASSLHIPQSIPLSTWNIWLSLTRPFCLILPHPARSPYRVAIVVSVSPFLASSAHPSRCLFVCFRGTPLPLHFVRSGKGNTPRAASQIPVVVRGISMPDEMEWREIGKVTHFT